jgi:3-hydroxyisobutyrate dehydrogenase
MAIIAFIGVGNMGGPMAANLVKAQHKVRAFDLSKDNLDRAEAAGAEPMGSMAEAVAGAEIVVTMLPAGPEVRAVYLGERMRTVQPGTLLIDASTIDVESARWVAAGRGGPEMLDARSPAGSAAPRPRRSPSWSAAPTRRSRPPTRT